MRVRVNFALIDQALFVVVKKFDRVFDGDHVLVALAINLVEHGGEGGGLARAGWPRNEHESARLVAEDFDHLRQSESFEALDLPWNRTEHSSHGAALVENIAAEARQALQTEREVELEAFFEPMLLRVSEHRIGQRLRVCRGERRHIERTQLAVHANARWTVGRKMKVTASHLDHFFQQFTQCDSSHGRSSLKPQFRVTLLPSWSVPKPSWSNRFDAK